MANHRNLRQRLARSSGRGKRAKAFAVSNVRSELPRRNRVDGLLGISGQFVEPAMSVAKRIDEKPTRFGFHRAHGGGLIAFARGSSRGADTVTAWSKG